jgi:hypothetical protein
MFKVSETQSPMRASLAKIQEFLARKIPTLKTVTDALGFGALSELTF